MSFVVNLGTEGGDALVSATVTSLTTIVSEFAAHCTEKLIDTILARVCQLMVSSTRPVVLSCLDFIRMFMSAVHSKRLPVYLQRLMDSLSGMDDEHQSAYRNRTRDIYSRMMRKCGADLVLRMVPPHDQVLAKRLKNLKKIEVRKKKARDESHKNEKQIDDDEDQESMATQLKTMEHVLADSDDDDLDENDVKDGRQGALKTWIQEDESSIVDFLDPAAAKKVSATNPRSQASALTAARKKKSQNLFKTAADGRMIIKDCSDSESSEQSEEGDISQAFDNLQVDKNQVQRKRKIVADDDEDQEEPSFKYQAGGSGIHRPISGGGQQKEKNDTEPGKRTIRKLTSKQRAQQSKDSKKPAVYGAEYSSSKARGDVKRKGLPDPYAFIPLSKSVLNKRKKAKAVGQFKGLMSSARRGAATGTKIHSKAKAKSSTAKN